MILEGRTLAAQIRESLPGRAVRVCAKLGRPIQLCAIGSTEDYGAYVYLKKEVEAAQKLGVQTRLFEINNQTPAAEFPPGKSGRKRLQQQRGNCGLCGADAGG